MLFYSHPTLNHIKPIVNPLKPPFSHGFPLVFPWIFHGFPREMSWRGVGEVRHSHLRRAQNIHGWAIKGTSTDQWYSLNLTIGDLMGFNGDLMGLNEDLMRI